MLLVPDYLHPLGEKLYRVRQGGPKEEAFGPFQRALVIKRTSAESLG